MRLVDAGARASVVLKRAHARCGPTPSCLQLVVVFLVGCRGSYALPFAQQTAALTEASVSAASCKPASRAFHFASSSRSSTGSSRSFGRAANAASPNPAAALPLTACSCAPSMLLLLLLDSAASC